MAGYCEHGIETSGSIKCGDLLTNYRTISLSERTLLRVATPTTTPLIMVTYRNTHESRTTKYKLYCTSITVGRVLGCKYFSWCKQHDLSVVYLIKIKANEPRKKCWSCLSDV